MSLYVWWQLKDRGEPQSQIKPNSKEKPMNSAVHYLTPQPPCIPACRRPSHLAAWAIVCALLVLGLAVPVLAMPPHPRIQKAHLEFIKKNPAMAPQALSARGIDAPAIRPDGSRVFPLQRAPERSFKALAILVRFSDKAPKVQASFFDSLLFGPAGSTVRNYYGEVSYGDLDIVTVDLPSSLGWNTAPQTYSYYCNGQNGFGTYPRNAQKLVEDVVALANPLVNYANYDNDGDGYVDALFVIHTGPGAEFTGNANDIWSHAWSTRTAQLVDGVRVFGYSMEPEYWDTAGDMTAGVYAHELGHVLGLPDWYDYNYASSGVGDWCLMAGGSWNGANGSSPAHMSAEGRWRLGFVTPVEVIADSVDASIPQVETSPTVYRLGIAGHANEYFLVENRQKVGYDAALPGAGLLVWHVDQNMNGNDNPCRDEQNCNCTMHYELALEQADGLRDLEYERDSGDPGDPFPGSTGKIAFDLNTSPNSGSYANCSSAVSLANISPSGATMTADLLLESTPIFTDIKANGSNGPITIQKGNPLSLACQLTPGDFSGVEADWWLVVQTPLAGADKWYHYASTNSSWVRGLTPTYQGPLTGNTFGATVNSAAIPPGKYTFYFGVDLNSNSVIDQGQLTYDSVDVQVNP